MEADTLFTTPSRTRYSTASFAFQGHLELYCLLIVAIWDDVGQV